MLSRSEFAQQIDGPSVEQEIDRLTNKGGSWFHAAQILSRRINGTLDWEPTGPAGARYSVIASRGEAVLMDDREDPASIIKLRGREENGYGTAGFGCVLVRNSRGLIDYGPGTMEQAAERERLSWQHLGFGCVIRDVIGKGDGLLLAQRFIRGTAPTEREIWNWMHERGWEWLKNDPDVSNALRPYAWRRNGIGAFDANETNFIKSDVDGELYPIDLIIWHYPE